MCLKFAGLLNVDAYLILPSQFNSVCNLFIFIELTDLFILIYLFNLFIQLICIYLLAPLSGFLT